MVVVAAADRSREPGHGLVQPRAVPRERRTSASSTPTTKLPVDTFEGLLFKSAVWIVGLLIIFVPLAIRLYRKLD